MAIRIVTDSVSNLSPAVAQADDITVVPLYVNIGREGYRDGLDVTADRFYARLEELPRLPITSQPSVADFRRIYQRLLDQGHQVVSIHVSARLSGTLNSAKQARVMLGEAAPIEIVDSRLAGDALALLALSGTRWTRALTDYREVAQRVRQAIESIHGFVVVDTLKYLEKGGRIGKAQSFLGGMLQFKPILGVRDGEIHPLERPRTRRRAHRRIVEIVRDLAPLDQIQVSYSTGQDYALALCDDLADLVEPERLIVSRFGPVLGTHLGPNTVGVAVTQRSGTGE